MVYGRKRDNSGKSKYKGPSWGQWQCECQCTNTGQGKTWNQGKSHCNGGGQVIGQTKITDPGY